MADIQIPQRNPQYVAPVMPTDLINSYLNRQQENQKIAAGAIPAAVGDYIGYQQKQQALKAGAFEAGGPVLMDALYGNGKLPTQTPSPQPQGSAPQPQGGMPQPAQDQSGQSGIPETIQATLNHPQLGVHAQKILALQNQMGQNLQMGKYGQTMNAGLKDQLNAETALMGGEQFQQGQDRQQRQFEQSQNAEEDRFQRGQQLKAGQSSAEVQGKYQLPEMKIQVANQKLQDLYDAYNKVPQTQKGPGIGLLTSKAGSFAGGAAPDLVTYNKLREAAAVSLAIARNPENPRPSPQDIQDELKNLPSAGDASQVAHNLFNATARDLQQIHNLNTQGAQASVNAFGGKLQPSLTPKLSRGNSSQVPSISSQAQYEALPQGASYTYNGQPHIKGRS